MDAHDLRIFCALAISGPPDDLSSTRPRGLRGVARGLGLDEKTVRVRLRRLEAEGFIKYYQAAPDLRLLGMTTEVTCRFEAVNLPTKRAALEFARQQRGMVEGLDFVGNTFVVTVAGADAPAAEAVHRAIAHRFELERYVQGRRELTDPTLTPAPLDWRIVERLRYDGRAPAEEVASGLGLTARIVRYRLGRLRASGAVSVRPILDARRLGGAIVYRLSVSSLPDRATEVGARLQRTFGDSIWAFRQALGGPLLLDMVGYSLAEPEEAVVRALALEGVDACAVLLLKEIVEPPRDSWIDRAIAALASRPVRSPPVPSAN